MDAIGLKLCDVAACGCVLPHAHVHRRDDEHRLVGREQGGGGEVVGEAIGGLGHEIGSRRRHDDQVSRARQLDMAHLGFVGETEEFLIDLLARERTK